MELIRRAIERAQSGTAAEPPAPPLAADLPPQSIPSSTARVEVKRAPAKHVVLNDAVLEAHRIVAHDVANPLRKSFDILRTQVLQAMDEKDYHLLAVTSPSPGCGKTVTAINLALSIARQPQRSVVLMDLDLQRPQVAKYIGVPCDKGLLGVLGGGLSLPDATIQARTGTTLISAMLAEGSTEDSSEWMTSQAMETLLKEIRRVHRSQTIIIDMPPLLTSDDVMAILPQIDCVLFVTAAGVSTKEEVEDCARHLQATDVVRVVLNKASEASASYPGAKYY